jgi:hypothetical protein
VGSGWRLSAGIGRPSQPWHRNREGGRYTRGVDTHGRPVVEVVDERMASVLRLKTPAQRLEMAFAMWRSAREMLTAMLQRIHPDWSEEDVAHEVARRLSHGAC